MTQNKKLNLSAMTNTSETKNENTSEPVKVETAVKPSSGIKINLASIKSQGVVKTPQVTQQEEVKKEVETTKQSSTEETVQKNENIQETKVLQNNSQEDTEQKINSPIAYTEKNDENNSEKNEKTESKKLQISALKKPLEKSNIEETNHTEIKKTKISELKKPLEVPSNHHREDALMEKIAQDNQQPKINPNEVFHNYESEYKKKQGHILDSIEKIKEIANIKKLSKTNKIFIGSIVGLTAFGIWFLFHIDPNTHSLDNYKASILTLAGKQMTQEEIKQHEWTIQEEIAWKLEENKLGWYDLGFEILVDELGNAVYKFDGQEYTSKELLDVAIYSKLEELKKDRIRDYFKNSSHETSNDSPVEENKNTQNTLETEENNFDETQSSQEVTPEENMQENNSSMDILMENYSEENDTQTQESEENYSQEEMYEEELYMQTESEMYEEEFIFE